jgi:predicted O-methyltransferase YrrM
LRITDRKIEEYILGVLPPRDKILNEMENYAAQTGFPIIGPMVGRILRLLAIATNAKKILELGSGFGYSAYWFAGGMAKGGEIICTDRCRENAERGMKYLKRGGFDKKATYYVGDALDILKNLKGPFDIILNDIDKKEYPRVLELAVPLLRKGGLFISDNVLWEGRILYKNKTAVSESILEFNRLLFSSNNVFSSIMPIRDGIALAVKLK